MSKLSITIGNNAPPIVTSHSKTTLLQCYTTAQINAIFSKSKKFKAMVPIDDL